MQDADVVLLGETHDDSIAHQLQLQLMLGALKQVKRWAATVQIDVHKKDMAACKLCMRHLTGLLVRVQGWAAIDLELGNV